MKLLNKNLKILSVIFLTLLFSIIDVLISNYTLLVSCFFCFVILCSALVVSFSLKKIKVVDESIPTFLNFLTLTMSTGKSFANAFEIAILYQRKSVRPFYNRIYHRIFYLKEEKSFLFCTSQHNFYQKLFQISHHSSHQREKLNQLKLHIVEKMEVKRKEKSLRAPFWAQIYIFCLMYVSLMVWHLGFRERSFEIETLSFGLFILGVMFSVVIGRPKHRI